MRKIAVIGWVLVVAAGFGGAAHFNQRLTAERARLRLVPADPLENSPPLVAFTTVALGGFRGLLADLLWLRANQLQEDGQYFELVQLADWIAKLEPRFTTVWAFQSWNMAYNISVLLDRPQDRWRWVRHGISLLRDEGLRYNPGSASLYRELAWLFYHKLGGDSDQAQLFYKKAWAAEMAGLFDGPQPDYARWQAVAASRAALLQRPGVAACLAQMRELGQDPFDAGLLVASNRSAAVSAVLDRTPAARDVLDYLRVQRLREEYRMEPRAMQQVDAAYGPLDWRLPQAHALYWAVQGQPFATGFDAVTLDRQIFQALADGLYKGRLFFNPEEDAFIPSPNFDLLPRVNRLYEESIRAHPGESTFLTARANFLRQAIALLYLYHRDQEAADVLAQLRRLVPEPGEAAALDAFVYKELAAKADALSQDEALAQIEGMAYQSALWLVAGEREHAAGMDQLARQIWKRYMDQRTDPDSRERTGLPPYGQIRRQALDRARTSAKSAAGRARLDAAPAPY
ncbi:MAG: hypothetical protein NTV49_00200 [Kiritimatiellaeota bacterium]|nr:hypothetical protein [Kiritimatiellota bacterium]